MIGLGSICAWRLGGSNYFDFLPFVEEGPDNASYVTSTTGYDVIISSLYLGLPGITAF